MDRLEKKILKHLNKQENASSQSYDFDNDLEAIAEKTGSDPDTVRACVRWLEKHEYVNFVQDNRGHTLYFELDHKGLHWKEYRRKEIRDYIADKWIDGLAMLVSLAALWISLFLHD